jgi:hypothetical protein
MSEMPDLPDNEYESDDTDAEVIVPRFKMIVSYDLIPSTQDSYYQFVLGEMVPAMQEMGVYMTEAWHTAYGEYPVRMVSFVAEEFDTINEMLESQRWHDLETRLQNYIRNYTRKVVEYRQGFQFVGPNQN